MDERLVRRHPFEGEYSNVTSSYAGKGVVASTIAAAYSGTLIRK